MEAYLPLQGPHLDEYEKLLRTEKFSMALQVGRTSFEKGQERMLLRVLAKRFGPISEAVRQWVEQMSSEQLDAIADALLMANSLAELGLEGEPPASS